MSGRMYRLSESEREKIDLFFDGEPVRALQGDSVLVALLNSCRSLRRSDFGDGERAGFCLMGACQDCWVWTIAGERVRSCTTPAVDGDRFLSARPRRAQGGKQ